MYKVSVIIPMYKVEEYLRQCLDSVVGQTLKEIEVICVDDGSPDSSAQIAAEYVAKYSNFKLLQKENGGLSSARNAGIEAASGEYLYFLDSDDYIAPETLERLYGKAHPHSLDIVYFNTHLVFESEEIRNKNQDLLRYYSREKDYSGMCSGQSMFDRMLKDWKFFPSACLQLFRREFLLESGIRFFLGIVHEDVLFSFQCAMTAQRTDYVPDKFYFRRMRDESITTNSKSMRNVEGYLVSYAESLRFLSGVETEEALVPVISNYLYISMYRNAFNTLRSLDKSRRSSTLTKGGFAAQHFLDVAYKDIAREEGPGRLRRAYNRLSGVRGPMRLVRKALGLVISVREHGVKTAIRGAAGKIRRVTVRLLRSLKHRCKNGLRKTGRFLDDVRKLPRKSLVSKLLKNGDEAPLVSFILPVYNVEKYLEECLDSLIRQTIPYIEIICVDDGSTDRSLEILNRYAEKDSRVRVFTQQNRYAGAARNLGLSKATGEYVCFLDSDDFFAETLAEDAYYAAKLNKADVVIYGARHFDDSTKQFKDAPWLFRQEYTPLKEPFSYKNCPGRLYQITTPCPWTKMFRREFVLKSGLQFQNLRNSNDLFFVYTALAMARRIATVNKPLVTYRVGMATNLQATKKKEPLCFYEAYKALHDKLTEIGVMDTLRQSYVNVVLSGCLYNLRSQKDPEVKQLVYDALKNEAFDALELAGYDRDYYYARDYYEELTKMVGQKYNYQYLSRLSRQYYPQALKKWYREMTGNPMNLEEPKTFNEKIQWLKLYDNTPLKTQLADKYLVRDWVKNTIGERYLIKMLGVWDRFDDIDFSLLPDQFVLKAVHGSGWNIIVRDKATFDKKAAKEKFDYWMTRTLTYGNGLEMHYLNIPPRIVAEEFVADLDGDIMDYRFFCFNGQPRYVWVDIGSGTKHHKRDIYDMDWNLQDYRVNYPNLDTPAQKPENFDEMVELATKMCREFVFVRVDLYNVNGKIYFGEMTFTPQSGRGTWEDDSKNLHYGELMVLPEEKKPLPPENPLFR